MKSIAFVFLSFLFYGAGCAQVPAGNTLQIKSLTQSDVKLDGQLSEKEWTEVTPVDLRSPWVKRTDHIANYRSFTDRQYFYFGFEVTDTTLMLYVSPKETDVAKGDRVELFFSDKRDLKNYYCLEMSPADKVLSYRAKHYRVFDNSWDLPGLVLSARVKKGGYTVEGRIPLAALRQIAGQAAGDTKPFKLYTGVFCGDYFGADENDVEWHSWFTPKSATPDFHIPSAFGVFEFE